MGFEFDDNGKFVGWSDLFNYSTIEALNASTLLPIPQKINYKKTGSYVNITELLKSYKESKNEDLKKEITKELLTANSELIKGGVNRTVVVWDDKSLDDIGTSLLEELNTESRVFVHAKTVIDINQYIDDIVKLSGNEPKKIEKYAELLSMLEDSDYEENEVGYKSLFVTWDPSNDKAGLSILQELNIHEFTKISPLLIEKAYKNLVSSRIQSIVQDLRNMDAAYSPIEMLRIRKASESSPKGELASNMTLMNPLTKYLMQVSNMVGKGVIGITAVGEKVFFNNSYYWNEGIRSSDYKWHRNMKFSQTFNRISGRASGNIEPQTKTVIANANFDNLDYIRLEFTNISILDRQLREEYKITDEDVINKTKNWEDYYNHLIRIVKSKQDVEQSADLVISELLSAATDNAKELILSKINAGTNLARMYLHLIIMGFNINDIVSFMISPVVSLINDLSEANMFDEYMYNIKVEEAAGMLRGKVQPSKFFVGQTIDYESGDSYSNSSIAFGNLKRLLNNKLGTEVVKINGKSQKVPKNYTSLEDLIQDFIYYRLQNKVSSIEELLNNDSKIGYSIKGGLLNLSDFIENIVSKMRDGISKYNSDEGFAKNYDLFMQDLDEFDKVWQLATETSTLGSTFYGLNQGLPTSKVDLLSKLRSLQSAVSDREEIFEINSKEYSFDGGSTSKSKNLDTIINKLQGNNPLLEQSYIVETLKMATQLNIVNNFDIESWLLNKPVSFQGSTISISNYREAITEYYNIIKGTWNIFDMIQKIPHYNSIFELLKTVYVSDYATVQKSYIVNMAAKEIMKQTNYMDDQDMQSLLNYINELLIINWTKQESFQDNFKFVVQKGWEQFNRYVDRVTSSKHSFLDLSTSEGRASFKLIMETKIIPSLQDGYYDDITITKDSSGQYQLGKVVRKTIDEKNPFIRELVDNIEQGVPFKKLNMDMLNVNATPASSIKFFDCLSGLYELKNKFLYGQPLSSWFMLYNIIVNQNQYGSDRMTTIFKPFIGLIQEDSLIYKYFQEVGNLDFKSVRSMDDLYEIGFNMKDALIKMAKYTSVQGERTSKGQYIKQVTKSGETIYKEKVKSKYKQISILPMKTLSGDGDQNKRRQRQKDFRDYWVIKTPMYDSNMLLKSNLESRDVDKLTQSLIEYMSKGIIKIYKYNC